MIDKLKPVICLICSAVRSVPRTIGGFACRTWLRHCGRLRDNPAYAAALAAGAATAVSQRTPSDLIATLVAAGLTIYAALRRSVVTR